MSPLKEMEGQGTYALLCEPTYTCNHSGEKYNETGQLKLEKDQVMFLQVFSVQFR